jgi:hypothetical protein
VPPQGRKARPKAQAAAKRAGKSGVQLKPGPKRITHAQRLQRDQLISARRAQGWDWPKIAKEAGVSVRAAQDAHRRIVDSQPLNLKTDPARIVEHVFDGVQQSIAGFEAIAAQALERNNLSSAVGAKRSANDARQQIMVLLQMTGRLPQDLSALRHLIDLRALAVRMLDAMDKFERGMAQLELDAETRKAVDDGVLEVRGMFNELVGIEQQPARAADDVEGTAKELTA